MNKALRKFEMRYFKNKINLSSSPNPQNQNDSTLCKCMISNQAEFEQINLKKRTCYTNVINSSWNE